MYWAQAPTPHILTTPAPTRFWPVVLRQGGASAHPIHINIAPASTRLTLLVDGRFAVLRWLQYLFYGHGERVL